MATKTLCTFLFLTVMYTRLRLQVFRLGGKLTTTRTILWPGPLAKRIRILRLTHSQTNTQKLCVGTVASAGTIAKRCQMPKSRPTLLVAQDLSITLNSYHRTVLTNVLSEVQSSSDPKGHPSASKHLLTTSFDLRPRNKEASHSYPN